MYLVAGLGNPGTQYEMTRHNIGFEVIDYIADKYNVNVKKLKFKGLYGEISIKGEKVILLKPQTYMNLSGESIREFAAFFKIPVENIIIINDIIEIIIPSANIGPNPAILVSWFICLNSSLEIDKGFFNSLISFEELVLLKFDFKNFSI